MNKCEELDTSKYFAHGKHEVRQPKQSKISNENNTQKKIKKKITRAFGVYVENESFVIYGSCTWNKWRSARQPFDAIHYVHVCEWIPAVEKWIFT